MTPSLAALLTFVPPPWRPPCRSPTLRPAGLNAPIAAGHCGRPAAGVAAFVHTRRLPANRHRRARARPLSPWAWLVFAAFALFALREFCLLVYIDARTTDSPQVVIGSPNNLGDISLHLHSRATSPTARAGGPTTPKSPASRCAITRAWTCSRPAAARRRGRIHALAWVGLIGSRPPRRRSTAGAAASPWRAFSSAAGWRDSVLNRCLADYQARGLEKPAAGHLRHATAVPLRAARRDCCCSPTGGRNSSATRPPTCRDDPAAVRAAAAARGLLPFWVRRCCTRRCRCSTCSRSCSSRCCWAGGSWCISAARDAPAPPARGRRGARARDRPDRPDDRQFHRQREISYDSGWMPHAAPCLAFWLVNFGLLALLARRCGCA